MRIAHELPPLGAGERGHDSVARRCEVMIHGFPVFTLHKNLRDGSSSDTTTEVAAAPAAPRDPCTEHTHPGCVPGLRQVPQSMPVHKTRSPASQSAER
eukprot:5605568-Prymnesium_polylepis.2